MKNRFIEKDVELDFILQSFSLFLPLEGEILLKVVNYFYLALITLSRHDVNFVYVVLNRKRKCTSNSADDYLWLMKINMKENEIAVALFLREENET